MYYVIDEKLLDYENIYVMFFTIHRTDFNNKVLYGETSHPLLNFTSNYVMDGNILIWPIRGSGIRVITIRK